MTTRIHVVAGVIKNAANQVLIALRPQHTHQGGLWEFPGGKVEADETALQALQRELQEELAIQVQQARPLLRVHHAYPDKTVLLDVWLIQEWQGKAWGREGQPIEWCTLSALNDKAFPAANTPIIKAVQLPDRYLVTPEPTQRQDKTFFYQLEATLDNSPIELIQVRAKHLSAQDYGYLTERVLRICEPYAARCLMNTTPALATSVGAHGVHLTSEQLHQQATRPLSHPLLVAASCHTLTDIQQANQIDTDFIVYGAVRLTDSHPELTTPLGWAGFYAGTEQAHCPVFAIGGMQVDDLTQVWQHGGQGIAAIRGLWQI